MAIPSHEELSLGGESERHEIVVVRIIGHDAGRIPRVIERYALLEEPLGESLRFFLGDVVLVGYPRMKKRPYDLLDEPGANDQFEFTIEPQIEKFGGGSLRGESSRDQAVGIDEDMDRSRLSLALVLGTNLMDRFGCDIDSLFVREPGLGSDPLDDAKPLSESGLQNLRLALVRASGADPHLSHETLVDRERRLHPCHPAILPYFPISGKRAA